MTNIQEKIEDLLGSCESLNIDEFSTEELEELDSQIFQCDTCGWWYEVAEQAENIPELICQDCSEE